MGSVMDYVLAGFVVCLSVGVLLMILRRFGRSPRSAAQELRRVDCMAGLEFENYVGALLKHNGFSAVNVTQGSGDFGADIICQKHGKKYAVQCKCYTQNVGVKAVQEVFSAMQYYKADVAVVLTNARFTKQARRLAHRIGVELWDRDKLTELIRAVTL